MYEYLHLSPLLFDILSTVCVNQSTNLFVDDVKLFYYIKSKIMVFYYKNH